MVPKMGRGARLSSQEKNDIYNWFCSFADPGKYDYCALFSRRCHNLFEAILFDPERESRELFTNVTTGDGLLLHAEKIAEAYLQNHAFPRMAIADDIVAHGRKLNSFLGTFYKCVCDFLERAGKKPDSSVEMDFYKSITLYVYAVNKSDILLRQEYQWRLRCQKICAEDELRLLAYKFSQESTQFPFSVHLPGLEFSHLTKWARTYGESGGDDQPFDSYDFFVCRDYVRPGVCPSVRVYRHGDDYGLTPFLFLSDVRLDGCLCVIDRIADIVDNASVRRIASVIKEAVTKEGARGERIDSADHVAGQFMGLLCSQILLQSFLNDAGVPIDRVDFDVEKIARSYGFSSDADALAGFTALCNFTWPEGILDDLYAILEIPSVAESIAVPSADTEYAQYKRQLEDVLYDLAIVHEENAKWCSKISFGGGYVSLETMNRTGEKSIYDLAREVSGRLGLADNSRDSVEILVLPLLTKMADSGDVSLEMRAIPDRESKQSLLRCYVRNTELSLSIMPRRIKKHYSEFYRIARLFWSDDDFPALMEELLPNSVKANGLQDADNSDDLPDKQYLKDAVDFAKIIRQHRSLATSLVNWKSVVES